MRIMPSAPGYKRDYAQESRTAKRRGEDKDNASRKRAARSKPKCNGDVDHIDGNPQNNSPSNLRCVSVKSNRSFSRKGSGSSKYGNGKRKPKSEAQNARAYN